MNGTVDINQITSDDESGLDPRSAAQLLEQTEKQAKRQLTARPGWLRLFVAGLVFVLYGCLYMAARGQHPYVGPHGPWLGVMALVLGGSSVLRVAVFGRALTGLSGATTRLVWAGGAAIIAGVVCVYALDGALIHAHASKTIVWGVFDASGPLLVLAGIWAGISAARESWWDLGSAVALMAVAAGAAFAGPVGVWGVIAIGSCLALLPPALASIWRERR